MIKQNFSRLNIVPTWVIMFLDLICVGFAVMLALLIRASFKELSNLPSDMYWKAPLLILPIRAIFFLLFRTERMVVRYTNAQNVIRIFLSCLGGTIFIYALNKITYIINGTHLIPVSIPGMEFFISTVFLIIYRLSFKLFYLEQVNPTKLKKNIIIFGAGESGITTKKALDRDVKTKYNVLAFIDEDPKKVGKEVENLPVIKYQRLDEYLQKNNISFLIISVQDLPASKKNEITEIALPYNVKVLQVPPVTRWINGSLSFKQIKKVKIEDLLERDPIVMDKRLVSKDIVNKTILITGAAGSIGSEIVQQLLNFNYGKLILVDNSETPVFFLRSYCNSFNHLKNVEILVCDITDTEKMEEVFSTYKPQLVYHAAAYKHVPIMEENPQAAIKVNVQGTRLLADLSVKYNVEKFVMISTDKAVNPTGVMGASKRIAEIYVQSLNFHQECTKFITTRFGNVLGSKGSVIPIFKRQIENGGPITVTHPDITRYFMTIPEACQLVLTAGAVGNGGEIFIFDMGQPVKIYDLAVKMIKLSGLVLGKDIEIRFSGLREGEKLYEELLANQENTIQTDYKKIMIANVRRYEYESVSQKIAQLIALKNSDPFVIVKKMKEIVPEFISNNSKFDILN
jgi:FlaA1/EpsC-like NDP-sugar epimerase